MRLHEKGGKRHEMPCHHKLEAYLHDYAAALGSAGAPDPKAWLFPTAEGSSGHFTARPMGQSDAYRMIRRRATDAGIETKIGCHSFRATGITEYLRNGGKLEIAQQMANPKARAPPASTTGAPTRSPSTRSNGSGYKPEDGPGGGSFLRCQSE